MQVRLEALNTHHRGWLQKRPELFQIPGARVRNRPQKLHVVPLLNAGNKKVSQPYCSADMIPLWATSAIETSVMGSQ